jgi:hypothetical protein
MISSYSAELRVIKSCLVFHRGKRKVVQQGQVLITQFLLYLGGGGGEAASSFISICIYAGHGQLSWYCTKWLDGVYRHSRSRTWRTCQMREDFSGGKRRESSVTPRRFFLDIFLSVGWRISTYPQLSASAKSQVETLFFFTSICCWWHGSHIIEKESK